MPYIRHLYYEEAGSGYPVILIHCPALSHRYWRPIMERLRDRCHCIAIDIRGHGRSGPGESPWSFPDIAADLEMLIQRMTLPRAPVLVGYSSGGSICLQALLDGPDRYAGAVLIGGFSECTTTRLRAKVRLGLLAVRSGLTAAVGSAVAATNHTDPEHRREVLSDTKRLVPHALNSFLAATLRADFTPRLGEIRQPVLLLYGEKDEGMHGYYRILRRGLRKAQTIFVPGADHRVPTRYPDLTANLLADFVSRMEPGLPDPLVQPTWEHPALTDQPWQ